MLVEILMPDFQGQLDLVAEIISSYQQFMPII